VLDLASAHLCVLKTPKAGYRIYNVGTGVGTSVLGLVHAFEEANQLTIKTKITDRRSGDVTESTADVSKIKKELGWSSQYTIQDICKDAWNFEKKQSI